ncbi:uncharacterized protein PHACADRAFT_104481 [Phanerochaete carnosa HHB-10118-sp]|uniref:Yeast cell wall synthesis Kre9/Knh1-like N-terminal domain-containing protein n=1 Tax=Phanerochaete carnosa (strain HHB-10118-sp) TaxID=650164 RepID=K5VVJ8_PHACS|nr:uncharacterized protein PHACADRAFT_104372 [Phanerochaete carnosa HHB-10118-sp]XP_007401073.1 uncharacterized protein PHACADRAFT_104481 [Phanerochaete carnosa HHB-10118-sp]EKM50800.1 hypothetical protein PHACADRAFT_104372 [Phanerochaete carnosa HHB-10118-sp]EKM50813.1 hypothetical protein PHACADRAFT_104481 [Phanerochaete carnosa HHB-10118-sp]
MFSKTTLFAALLATAVSVVARPQDVWDPTITSPTAGVRWLPGDTHNITWDTSNAPADISEGSQVVLAKGGVLDSANPLAQGFDLRAGFVPVTIPVDTIAGDDYAIVLFGDSGNLSPTFTIL